MKKTIAAELRFLVKMPNEMAYYSTIHTELLCVFVCEPVHAKLVATERI